MKVPPIFRKKLTEKAYEKKILKRLYINADREFIASLYGVRVDEKTGKKLYEFDPSKVTDKAAEKRVARIGKELKKQKGRINLFSVIGALLFLGAIILTFFVFRNRIARTVIVSSLENAFGSVCELEAVDFNVPEARFMLRGLAVSDREKPMKNLFEIGEAEFRLDLLWLTRGKFHVDRASLTHVAWSTDRSVTGALPPEREKAWLERKAREEADPDGGTATVESTGGASASPIDIASGFSAVSDMLDPKKILDAEIETLALPAVVEDVRNTVPALSEKWNAQNKALKDQSKNAVAAGKLVTSINPSALRSIPEIQAAIEIVKGSSSVIAEAVTTAKKASSEVQTDIASVTALSKAAEKALKNDSARLSELASSIKALDLQDGTRVLSSVFETFASATLGSWYPKAEKALGVAVKLQKRAQTSKNVSMKEKSGSLSRSSGRNVSFGVADTPTILFKIVELGLDSPGLSGSGTLSEITDDQDLNGKPSGFSLTLSHGGMGEKLEGYFDLRRASAVALETSFTGKGYRLAIDAPNTPGVPSVKGDLTAIGNMAIMPSGDAELTAALKLSEANISAEPFEPSWIHSAYSDVLSALDVVDADLSINAPRGKSPTVRIDTDADKALGAAIAASATNRIASIKKDVTRLANEWLNSQKNAYAPELSKFTASTGITPGMAKDILAYENAASKKQAELEQRLKDLAAEKAAEVQKAAEAAAAAAAAKAAEEANKAKDAATDATNKAAADAKKKATDAVKKVF